MFEHTKYYYFRRVFFVNSGKTDEVFSSLIYRNIDIVSVRFIELNTKTFVNVCYAFISCQRINCFKTEKFTKTHTHTHTEPAVPHHVSRQLTSKLAATAVRLLLRRRIVTGISILRRYNVESTRYQKLAHPDPTTVALLLCSKVKVYSASGTNTEWFIV